MEYSNTFDLLSEHATRILRHHVGKSGNYNPIPDAVYCIIAWHLPPAIMVTPELTLHTFNEAHEKCVAAIRHVHVTAIATTLLAPGGNRYLVYAATKDTHIVLVAPIMPPNFDWINGEVKPQGSRKPWIMNITMDPDWLMLSPLTNLPWNETPSLEETQARLATQFGAEQNPGTPERGH